MTWAYSEIVIYSLVIVSIIVRRQLPRPNQLVCVIGAWSCDRSIDWSIWRLIWLSFFFISWECRHWEKPSLDLKSFNVFYAQYRIGRRIFLFLPRQRLMVCYCVLSAPDWHCWLNGQPCIQIWLEALDGKDTQFVSFGGGGGKSKNSRPGHRDGGDTLAG